jgi:hypothetical protein
VSGLRENILGRYFTEGAPAGDVKQRREVSPLQEAAQCLCKAAVSQITPPPPLQRHSRSDVTSTKSRTKENSVAGHFAETWLQISADPLEQDGRQRSLWGTMLQDGRS